MLERFREAFEKYSGKLGKGSKDFREYSKSILKKIKIFEKHSKKGEENVIILFL